MTMKWFRNGGTKDKTQHWEPLGKRIYTVPDPKEWGNLEYRMEDINGDVSGIRIQIQHNHQGNEV